MDRHEEIKQLCAKILEYYYIPAETEYVLPNNQRIDIVGYYKDRMKDPDIGIEVEITSEFQKDAQKLTNPIFNWRFIVTEDRRTLSLGDIQLDGKSIEIVEPPDKSTVFEQIIRNIVKPDPDKKWYFDFIRDIGGIKVFTKEDLLRKFEEEINSQGLNVELAKDVIFRASLGGYHVGYYKYSKNSPTKFYPVSEYPMKELLYLKARGFIIEDISRGNYDSGKQSIYYITNLVDEKLVDKIQEERVRKKLTNLEMLQNKYSAYLFLSALIAEKGELKINDFSENPLIASWVNPNDYSYLAIDPSSWSFPKDIMEEFNLDLFAVYLSYLLVDSPLMQPTIKEIYESLCEISLGNKKKGITSRGNYYGWEYYIPLKHILRNLDVNQWKDSLNLDKLKEYAKWLILRSHNPNAPSTLIQPLSFIGCSETELLAMVNELFQEGITSKILNTGVQTFAIYDIERYNNFCENKMKEVLHEIFGW